jgi:KDO2-lipid IV(A) lauroyltransferase
MNEPPDARPSLSQRVEVWILAGARAAACCLPIGFVSWLGGAIAAAGGSFSRRNKRVMSNLAIAFPDMPHADRQRIARGMWENYGRTVAESLIIDRIAADPGRVILGNEEWVRSRLQSAKGVVFAGLHFGNWEATIVPALEVGQKPIGIFKPLKNPAANAFLLRLRTKLYPAGLLPATRATVLRVARHVRSGGSVCVLSDHRDRSGIAVPFFGKPAPSATLPALLSVSYDAPLLVARVDRLPSARFRVHVSEVEVSRTGDRDKDVLLTTAALQAKFEEWIRERPEAWVWCYKRWERVRPRGPSTESRLPAERSQ